MRLSSNSRKEMKTLVVCLSDYSITYMNEKGVNVEYVIAYKGLECYSLNLVWCVRFLL